MDAKERPVHRRIVVVVVGVEYKKKKKRNQPDKSSIEAIREK